MDIGQPELLENQQKPTYAKQNILMSSGVFLFWLLEFLYHFFWVTPDDWRLALIRSLAFSGTTLIGLALCSSIVFKTFPKTARHWRWRRRLGVSGFVLISFHVLAVYTYLLQWKLSSAYFSFNPIKNPIIFGTLAYLIYFAMAVVSNDRAVRRLGGRRWKFIHRLVYIAFWATIFHFLLINPSALKTLSGYLMMVVAGIVLLGQLFWFVKISAQKNFRSLGTAIGIAIIALYLVTGYLVAKSGIFSK